MLKCPVCNTTEVTTSNEIAMQACQQCADELGIIPMPPALRPPQSCTRCQGRKFTRVIPREFTAIASKNRQVAAPMLATHAPSVLKSGWHAAAHEVDIDTTYGYGMLELYACWGCGLVEWYCRDVQRMPIHPHLMTELVDHDASGPYR